MARVADPLLGTNQAMACQVVTGASETRQFPELRSLYRAAVETVKFILLR
jgi:hypothetical protein